MMSRLMAILDAENVEYEAPVLAELIMKHMPDWRKVLNELQRYSVSGKIDSGILVQLSDISLNNLITFLKEKNFKQVRKWVAENMDSEPAALYRKLYDNMNDHVESASIPQLVLILADYQYKNAFVADHELNTVACLTEVMAGVKFK